MFASLFGSMLTAAPMLQEPGRSTSDVEKWIRQLGDDQFETRVAATRELYRLGDAALQSLRQTEVRADREFNERVALLIAAIESDRKADSNRVGSGDPHSPANLAKRRKTIVAFPDADPQTQKLMLEQLLSLGFYLDYFDLLSTLDDQAIRETFEDNGMFTSEFARLCESDSWDLLDVLLSRPLVWRHSPNACAMWHHSQGTLEDQMLLMRKQIDDADTPDARDVTLLVRLATFQRDFPLAENTIARLPTPERQSEALNRMLLFQGDWRRLAQRVRQVSDDTARFDQHLVCTPAQWAVAQQFASEYQKVDDWLQQQRALPEGDQLEMAEEIQVIELLTLDWERARETLGADEEEMSVNLMEMLNRYGEPLTQHSVGDDLASRKKWAAGKRTEIQQLIDGIENEPEESDRVESANGELSTKIAFYVAICEHIAKLGLDEESVLHLRELYRVIHPHRFLAQWRHAIISTASLSSRPDLLWPFIENAGLSDGEVDVLVQPQYRVAGSRTTRKGIFGDQFSIASWLIEGMKKKIPDPVDRLKWIAGVLRSPLQIRDAQEPQRLEPQDGDAETEGGDPAEFNLDRELARLPMATYGSDFWHISLIYRCHQRDADARQWLELAVAAEESEAIELVADDCYQQGDFLLAAKLYERQYRATEDGYSLAMAGHAWQRAGAEQRGRRMVFYSNIAPDLLENGSIASTYRSYLDDDRGSLIADVARLQLCLADQGASATDLDFTYRCYKLDDPVQAAIFNRMQLFHYGPIIMMPYVAVYAIESRTNDVRAAVEDPSFGDVKTIFEQVERFSPGSPSMVEKIVPRLDELGRGQLADWLTDQSSQFHTDFLSRYPSSANHRNNFAWLLACARRRLDSVLRHAEMAVRLRPAEPTYMDTLAECHFTRGDLKQAVAWIDRALAIEPDRAYYRNQKTKFQAAWDREKAAAKAVTPEDSQNGRR